MTDSSRVARIAALVAFGAFTLVGSLAHAAKGSENEGVVIDTDDNLVLFGGRVAPAKPVPENFVGFGGRVVIDQPIGGNAVSAGGTVDVRAPVGGNGRFAGGTVNIDSAISGNVSAAGGDVRISKGATIGSRTRVMAGNAVIDGTINGELKGSADSFTINGTVNGDVKVAADTLKLGPGAKITGKLTYVSGGEVQRSEGATVGGEITRMDEASAAHEAAREEIVSTAHTGLRIFGTIVSYLALLACGAIFLAAAPIFSVEAPDRVRNSPAKSIGIGLLTIICTPIVAVLFMITVIGIPVGIMLFALYPFALLLGFLVSALFVASLIPVVLKKPPPPTVAKAIGHFAIALALVMLLAKVPSVGGVVLLVLLVVGVGAFEVELYRRMRSGSRARVEVVRP
ncbi:MAG TPA: polymer-forming cytoskeletal protein [Ramlibacter sp.]|nr:polymer-forming cytoskeletal protein [Ramlibacter sp.]